MPLDFIPINLFSTRSILPIPFLPAKMFNFCKRFPGDNFLPLIVVGSPFLNPIITKNALLVLFQEKLFFEK